MKFRLSQTQLVLSISVLFAVFYNVTFFQKCLTVYPLNSGNNLFLISLFILLVGAINLILNIIRFKLLLRFFLILLCFLSAIASYVMDSFNIAIDDGMILNVFKTNLSEAADLFTIKILIYIFFLFIIPSIFILKVKIDYKSAKQELLSRLKSIVITIVVIFVLLFAFGKNYASFFREQKPLRYYTNPTYFIYSIGRISGRIIKNPNLPMQIIGKDSIIPLNDLDRELIILVVGETARKDRFSLNGYKKETNPLLKKERVYSFTNVTSCGTSTAVSVPCLFSNIGRSNFSVEDGRVTQNLLDVLGHTKNVNILWRDNNSDSKGVATRAKYEDYKLSQTNTVCDTECRDEGMLFGLQEYINLVKEKDIVIVLHQMGNHGPAYYKRYPKEFARFRPFCETNDLSKCSNDEISNAYDNAILYTDYFLSKTIALLKNNSSQFSTVLLYVSDHGESLGENGVYLHSMPYMIAPKEQVEVPLIMWFGGGIETELKKDLLINKLNEPYSHDNIFHTMLGFMEIESSAYIPQLDILYNIQIHGQANSK